MNFLLNIKMPAFAFCLFFMLQACSSEKINEFPDGKEGLMLLGKQILSQPNRLDITLSLKPKREDCRAFFASDTVADRMYALLDAFYTKLDSTTCININPGQDSCLVFSTDVLSMQQEIDYWEGDLKDHFPQGYRKAAAFIKPEHQVYVLKFVEKSNPDLGRRYDGFVYLNGRWVMIPKPWVFLQAGA